MYGDNNTPVIGAGGGTLAATGLGFEMVALFLLAVTLIFAGIVLFKLSKRAATRRTGPSSV